MLPLDASASPLLLTALEAAAAEVLELAAPVDAEAKRMEDEDAAGVAPAGACESWPPLPSFAEAFDSNAGPRGLSAAFIAFAELPGGSSGALRYFIRTVPSVSAPTRSLRDPTEASDEEPVSELASDPSCNKLAAESSLRFPLPSSSVAGYSRPA